MAEPTRFQVAPYEYAAALELERALGLSHALAQVLVRRGVADPESARTWLEADEHHPASAFVGIDASLELVARHVRAGSRITIHGDYDVDGVCATAILVRCLRRAGTTVDWFLPSRTDDGYGLSTATVERLAARGTGLLVTADCAITAVEEVAAARAAGIDVIVTDHHTPRADGRLPDAPLVHPALCGYPCPDLCAAGVAYKLASALDETLATPRPADDDIDLVALATIADCVPLRGENRALVRAGLAALARTAKPGLRALQAVAHVDPATLDARAVAFRLAPRINAAGRLYRADAGVELVLTDDEPRAHEIAVELDAANAERRHVETRILFEAEAQVSAAGARAAYVLAGDGWHPGVIGIVASRIAERHHRPVVMIALDGERGTGSGRSIPAFDLLAALTDAAGDLERYGGHRAAAGLELRRERVEAFRARFEAFAAGALASEELVPAQRIDAVVSGDELRIELAEELRRLEPFGAGNPDVALLVPAATFSDPQPLAGGKHTRFTLEAGGARSRALAFGAASSRLAALADVPVDAAFALSLRAWNGTVEPQLVLRGVRPVEPATLEVVGEPHDFRDGVQAELDALPQAWPPDPPTPSREVIDRRGRGIAGTVVDLVASGERVLVLCADAARRADALADRLGGFALCAYGALEREPALASGYEHVVALDPPAHAHLEPALAQGAGFAHLAWGAPELRFAQQIHELEYGLRASLVVLYRALRDRQGVSGEELEAVLRGDGSQARSPALAGRALRVLHELGLVSLDRGLRLVSIPAAERTELEQSAAFRHYRQRFEDGQRYLSRATAKAA